MALSRAGLREEDGQDERDQPGGGRTGSSLPTISRLSGFYPYPCSRLFSGRFPANWPACFASCFFSVIDFFCQAAPFRNSSGIGEKRQANNHDCFGGRCWCCQKQLNVALKQKQGKTNQEGSVGCGSRHGNAPFHGFSHLFDHMYQMGTTGSVFLERD